MRNSRNPSHNAISSTLLQGLWFLDSLTPEAFWRRYYCHYFSHRARTMVWPLLAVKLLLAALLFWMAEKAQIAVVWLCCCDLQRGYRKMSAVMPQQVVVVSVVMRQQ